MVVTAKVAEDFPAATVTDAGTLAAVDAVATLMTRPPVGAAPLRVTVPVADLLPRTAEGETDTDRIAGGFSVKVAVREIVPRSAVTVTDFCAETPEVVARNVALIEPPWMVTDPGTLTVVALLDSLTTSPPAGAMP